MTSRERFLATGVLSIIVLAGGGFLFHQLVLSPLQAKSSGINLLEQQIEQKRQRVNQVKAERPKLERWRQLSLPSDTDLARREYEKYLSDLMRKSGFAAGSFTVSTKPADSKSSPTIPGKGPIYTKLSFQVQSRATLDSLVKMLEGFYHTGLLHQIRNIVLQRPLTQTAQGRPNELDVTLTVEALVLAGAENRQELFPGIDRRNAALDVAAALRGGSPGLGLALWALGPTGPKGHGVLAQQPRNYRSIAAKNIFFGPTLLADDRSNDVDVTRFMRLTTVYSDGQKPEAFVYDRYNGGKELRLRPSAGFDKLRVRDSQGELVVEIKVVRINIEDAEVILAVDGKYYALHIGQDLDAALRRPLAADKIKALGLTTAAAND